ncbi:GNAT family N-acetyltransferase [Photobacterium sp.]|uniref:GNAT family N-acetyltransferase n=1 Tax=Photobacterium sp. TaxID=660 RepID=UPI00299EE1F4|nr:GNAT family N-acetyltransferase [Photobacterium sp.]MDX1301322.1 GNAT family N-acetyltransferase [Photobacterium sp.]
MIEEVTDSDIPEIIVLIDNAIKTCIDVPHAIADDLVNHCADNVLWWKDNKQSAAHFLYRLDGRIVGVVLVKNHWNLANLFVDPDYHARGIGRDLVLKALSACKNRSAKGRVKLSSSNHAAGFYHRVGFEQIGDAKPLPGGCIPFEYRF